MVDERALEVVGHGVGEALELGVLRREVGALGPQGLLVGAQVARHAVERPREVPELVGRVEGQRVVEVAGGDLAGGAAHLGQRPGEAAGEEHGGEETQAQGDREGGRAQRQERGAPGRPHRGRSRLEPAQRRLPRRLREGHDAPAGRDARRRR